MSLKCKDCGIAISLCWNGTSSGLCRRCYAIDYNRKVRKMKIKALTHEQHKIEIHNMTWLRGMGYL